MKISVKKTQNGVYALTLDGAVHTLTTTDLKHLLMASVKALSPGALPTPDPVEEAHEFAERLKTADAPGLQKLIINARDDDMAAFLKATEDDTALQDMLFTNMSERKHKMLSEDLEFRFQDGVAPEDLDDAVIRLIDLANHLQNDGLIVFGGEEPPAEA